MIVYRLASGPYKDDISGTGARLFGGRWNSKGMQVLYTSSSIALCTVEIAVRTPLHSLPMDYFLIKVYIPDDLAIYQIPNEVLPQKWDVLPHGDFTQKLGDSFLKKGNYLIMKTPSACVEGDFNYLVNPFHPDFDKVKIIETKKFEFDSRLFS
ncbi:RES family NAD+ phosphorylase [Arcticibacterium luteifluviistationis]|uniref:RES superfamily protein n=1 Tax=Arcticibacterium luteifluviistationis TaxID=1784714 RepID=A0A2Z4GDB8_9BACT|nr:RES family NAD+ phosphorylase [Arcticibacterium luteifluviistationis]AWV99141.1 RES superfamily protein [Arcticibacterium luteifluviistationis]